MQPELILAQCKNGSGSASRWLDDIRGAKLLQCGATAAFGSVASLRFLQKDHPAKVRYRFQSAGLKDGSIFTRDIFHDHLVHRSIL